MSRGRRASARRPTVASRLHAERHMFRQLALFLLASSLAAPALAQTVPGGDVTRATLDNGLRVVIVRDPLAPVVTVQENYLVGANDTPPGFPGMAHAQEHMAFR